MASIVMEDVLGERRQQEIKDLVDRLAAFRPTKILLEYPYAADGRLNERYQQYRSSTYELRKNETDQIGFRLAAQLGHDRVYAIDRKMDLPFEPLMTYVGENDKMGDFQALMGAIQAYTAAESERLADVPLAAYFASTNTDAIDRFTNRLYLEDILAFGAADNEVGAQISATWWHRNMIITQNIARVIDSPQDRVLVIIGAAHRAVIKDFVGDRQDMEYVEIGGFLR